jgi:diguanylate cyclase (GGDEF)-like protein
MSVATILVVDDNATNRSFLTRLLSHRGHRVLEAANGVEGLDQVRAEHPDLVITDILMPLMDGYEFVRQLRAEPEGEQTKVMFYSATYLEAEARTVAQACGVSRVISKRSDPEEVLRAVEETLDSGEAVVPVPANADLQSKYVSILSNKLSEKVAELETLNAELEKRVTERTGELEASNLHLEKQIAERHQAERALRQANDRLTQWVSQLAQRTRETTLLGEMTHVLPTCLTIEEAQATVVRFAQRLGCRGSGGIYVLEHSGEFVKAVEVWGEPLNEQQDQTFSPGECWALRTERPYMVGGALAGAICGHVLGAKPAEYICVPMAAQGECLGVLHLRWSQGALDQQSDPPESRKRLAMALADSFALLFSNMKLHVSLKEQSIRDHLTGLFNRRYLEESLEREVHRALRTGAPIGVTMLDIDHFKNFNDTFGHATGDEILRIFGHYFLEHVREGDIPCRYGGEEFALILPGAPLEVAQRRAEALREGALVLGKDLLDRLARNHDPLTLSLGVAAFPRHGSNGSAVLRVADAALYRAKQSGRNKVVVAEGARESVKE